MNQRPARRTRGLSLIEVMISATLGVMVLGGSGVLLTASNELALSANRTTTVQTRVDRALWPIVHEIRRASLATIRKADDTTFSDGETSVGISISRVVGFDGSPILGPRTLYRLVTPAGAARGNLVAVSQGRTRVVARNVTAFSVTRTGRTFSLQISTREGPADDRGRSTAGSVAVAPRNP